MEEKRERDPIPNPVLILEKEIDEMRIKNLRLEATVRLLEDQNKLLMNENSALSESISVFIRLGPDDEKSGTGGSTGSGTSGSGSSSSGSGSSGSGSSGSGSRGSGSGSGSGSSAGDSVFEEWLKGTDLASRVSGFVRSLLGKEADMHGEAAQGALMLCALEALSALVHLATTLQAEPGKGHAVEEECKEADGDEALMWDQEELQISLTTAFSEAVRALTDVLLLPTGGETAELLEPYPNQWLINSFPFRRVRQGPALVSEAASRGREAWLPLHWYALAATPESVDVVDIEILMDHLPAAFQQDVSPLCIAVSKPSPCLEGVQKMLEKRCQAVSAPDADGSLPIMHACACNESLEAVMLLFEACPGSALEQDKQGFRAINYAAYSGYPQTVRYLLSVHPRSASLAARNGSTALHDAVENSVRGGMTMVDEVFQANTLAIEQPDEDGALPLHRAARAGTLEVVKYLHQLYPRAMSAEDREGLLPMHYASQRADKDLSLEVVQYILSVS